MVFTSLLPPFSNTISTLPLPIPAQIKLPRACWVTRLFMAAPPISGSRSLLVNLLVNFPPSRINDGKFLFWGKRKKKAVRTLRNEMPVVRFYTDDLARSFLLVSLLPRFSAPRLAGTDLEQTETSPGPHVGQTMGWPQPRTASRRSPLEEPPPVASSARTRRAAGGGGRPRPSRGSQIAGPGGARRGPAPPRSRPSPPPGACPRPTRLHCRPPAGEARTAPRRGLRAPAGLRRYRAPLPSRTQAQASRRDPARPRRLQAVLLPAPAWGLPSARPARLPPALTRRPTGPPSGARPAPAPQRYRPPSPGAGCRSSAAPS